MKVKCIVGADCYGYVNTKSNPIHIDKDKVYELELIIDPKAGRYYNVLLNNKIVTTVSESEAKIFFEEIKKEG